MPAHEFESPTYLPKRSDGLVSELKFTRLHSLPNTLQIISAERVFEVPVGPSSKTGIPPSI